MPCAYFSNITPPIAWLGGKSKLRPIIIEMIPPHTTYVEVFGGAMWVMFGKEKSKVEVYNDIDSDLVNLFNVFRNKELLEEFFSRIEYLFASREMYEAFIKQHPAEMQMVDRAVSFWYRLKLGFGGMVQTNMQIAGSFVNEPPSIDRKDCEWHIIQTYKRIRKMWIENLNFDELIEKWDKATTLFFVDPPYYETKGYVGTGRTFGPIEHRKLNAVLRKIKGKFIFTCNDRKEIREMYKEFSIKEAKVFYTMCKDKKEEASEIIITNFELKDQQLSFMNTMGPAETREAKEKVTDSIAKLDKVIDELKSLGMDATNIEEMKKKLLESQKPVNTENDISTNHWDKEVENGGETGDDVF